MRRAAGAVPNPSTSMTTEKNQLHVALSDSRQLPVAYPILAKHGLMERTENGFKSIDPEVIARRCRELLDRIDDGIPFSQP